MKGTLVKFLAALACLTLGAALTGCGLFGGDNSSVESSSVENSSVQNSAESESIQDSSEEGIEGGETTPELSLYEKINLELARAAQAKGYTLERVIGISFADTENEYSYESWANICFDVIAIKNEIESGLRLGYIGQGNSLVEMLESITNESYDICWTKNLVSYNSAQKFVESERYAGEMQKLYDAGYTITLLDSCVREGKTVGKKFRFEIVGTYKAVHENGDVKYFTSVNQIDVLEPALDEEYDYERSFYYPDEMTVTETQFILHEENGTLLYMEKLIESQEKALEEQE